MLHKWLNNAVYSDFFLLEALDDNDDVQNVWHNWDGADDNE